MVISRDNLVIAATILTVSNLLLVGIALSPKLSVGSVKIDQQAFYSFDQEDLISTKIYEDHIYMITRHTGENRANVWEVEKIDVAGRIDWSVDLGPVFGTPYFVDINKNGIYVNVKTISFVSDEERITSVIKVMNHEGVLMDNIVVPFEPSWANITTTSIQYFNQGMKLINNILYQTSSLNYVNGSQQESVFMLYGYDIQENQPVLPIHLFDDTESLSIYNIDEQFYVEQFQFNSGFYSLYLINDQKKLEQVIKFSNVYVDINFFDNERYLAFNLVYIFGNDGRINSFVLIADLLNGQNFTGIIDEDISFVKFETLDDHILLYGAKEVESEEINFKEIPTLFDIMFFGEEDLSVQEIQLNTPEEVFSGRYDQMAIGESSLVIYMVYQAMNGSQIKLLNIYSQTINSGILLDDISPVIQFNIIGVGIIAIYLGYHYRKRPKQISGGLEYPSPDNN